MKKILILFISVFSFFACTNNSETETSDEQIEETISSDEDESNNSNLEEDLGELESELKDSVQ